MAIPRNVATVGDQTANLLVGRDTAQKIGQHWCIANVVPGGFGCPELQVLFVEPKVDLAPDAQFRPAMLARLPISFTSAAKPALSAARQIAQQCWGEGQQVQGFCEP